MIAQGLFPGVKFLIGIETSMSERRQVGNAGYPDNLAAARPEFKFAVIVVRDLHGGIMASAPRVSKREVDKACFWSAAA